MKKGKALYTIVTILSVIITLAAVFGMLTVANPDLLPRKSAVAEMPAAVVEEQPMEMPTEESVEEAPQYAEIPEGASLEQVQAMEAAGELPPGTAEAYGNPAGGIEHTLVLNAWGGRTEMEVENVDSGEPQTHGFGATIFSRDYVFSYREEYIETDNCHILSCIARHDDGRTSDAWEVYTADVIETVDLPGGEEPQVDGNSTYFFLHNSEHIQGGCRWIILHGYTLIDDQMSSDKLFDMMVDTNIYAQVNWD